MKSLLILSAALGLLALPAYATDNVYQTSKKLTIGQFAGNCTSMGGTFTSNSSDRAVGTCSKSNGSNITCARENGVTTCVGYDPNRPQAPQ